MYPQHFSDLKPFPGAGEVLPGSHHNQPPLEDQVLMDFEEAVHDKGLDVRVTEIIESAGRAPEEITTTAQAGGVGDLLALAKAAKLAVEAEREVLNRPLLTAQRGLKGRADGLVAPMDKAIAPLRERLDGYMAALAEEEGKAVAHGDLGARVGARTGYEFKIVALAKLPKSIRQHPTVIEAIEKVIRGQSKAGERKIAGVEIWPAVKAAVR